MKMKRKVRGRRIRLFCIVFGFTIMLQGANLVAQSTSWSIGLNGFADNREYKSQLQPPESLLGTQLVPEFHLVKDTIHTFGVGFSMLSEFGHTKLIADFDFQLYYRYRGQNFNFTFGSFSKNDIYACSPKAIYHDVLTYYNPNIQGLLWNYHKGGGSQSVYLDWTGRKSETTRETFIMGTFGTYSRGLFFLKNHIYMYHYASANVPDPNSPLRDNGVAYLSVGANLNGAFYVDSLSLSVGGMQSYQRTRGVTDWETPLGLLFEVKIQHRGFGVTNTLYVGQGHKLDWGDPFYQLKRYNRLDIYFNPLLFESVRAMFGISLHFAEQKIHHQQQFFLKVLFNSDNFHKPDTKNHFFR
ncbi:MAG: hypothetical protein RBR13_09025 [Tenuifilaceae bacterium]|nr:hypothetical protein [Tenuifilaceae bacterium]